jgi:quercetin dioxygenase-like cupin family protein
VTVNQYGWILTLPMWTRCRCINPINAGNDPHRLLCDEDNQKEHEMTQANLFSDWRETVVYSVDGPQPQILFANDKVKVIVAGLEPGQKIPEHAESAAIYHFLEGAGWIIVDGERLAVGPGATVVMPDGTVRGMDATTRLAFLATRIA